MKYGGFITCPVCGDKRFRIVIKDDGEMVFNFTDATDPKTWDGSCRVVNCPGVIFRD